MDIQTTTSALHCAPDAATWLKLADNYIQAYNKLPNRFVLPSQHSILKPIIEHFAGDLRSFALYIKALRDGAEGGAWDELHDLYRTVSLRALQQTRRARIRRAVDLVSEAVAGLLGRKPNFDEQQRIGRLVETHWGAKRLQYLQQERTLRRINKLSAEERSIALDQFWSDLDAMLESGEHGLSDEAVRSIAAKLESLE